MKTHTALLIGILAVVSGGCVHRITSERIVTINNRCYEYKDDVILCDQIKFRLGKIGYRRWKVLDAIVDEAPAYIPAERKTIKPEGKRRKKKPPSKR